MLLHCVSYRQNSFAASVTSSWDFGVNLFAFDFLNAHLFAFRHELAPFEKNEWFERPGLSFVARAPW